MSDEETTKSCPSAARRRIKDGQDIECVPYFLGSRPMPATQRSMILPQELCCSPLSNDQDNAGDRECGNPDEIEIDPSATQH